MPITCWTCRAQLGEEGEAIPCDTGGLAACYFWRTHGYSPGTPVHADDLQAWEIYWQVQRVGWETVRTLRQLDQLDAYDADWLLVRLVTLQDYVQAQQREAQEQR